MATDPPRIDWELAYRHAYPSVYRALVAVLLDADLAQDALHDAFLAGIDRPPRHGENVPGWLFRVAVRRAGRLRRRRMFRFVAPRVMTEHDEIDAVLDRLAVGQLLRMLTERQRTVVVAYFYLEQTQEQIAESLESRRGTVAATISQALARMRKEARHVG